jgi:hypothetical protein
MGASPCIIPLTLNIFAFKDLYRSFLKSAASRQKQHSAFATSMDPDQPAHARSLIRIHAVRLPTLLQVAWN